MPRPRPLFLIAVSFSFLLTISLDARQSSESPPDLNLEAANSLFDKIIAIRNAENSSTRSLDEATTILVTETEMESFVFFSMGDEIPARVDSIDVTVGAGTIAAATELTFDSEESSGNPIVDLLLESPHSLFVRGALEGHAGEGTFELQQVRVDGFPVPIVIVEVLIDRYVNPRFPEVDLDEGFLIPWSIEEIVLTPDGAEITY